MKHVKTRNRVVREVSDKHTMNIRVLFSLVFLIVITFTVSAQTAVWQWAVPVRNFAKQPKNPDAKAYLWIPEKCKHVKAVLVAQHNMEEISIMEDENFRIKMAELDVAQIWVCPSFNHGFDFTDGAWETLEGFLKDLASVSGYTELASAPLIGIGHSAAASWPYYLAAYMPDRTLACISVSGQWPYVRDKWLNLDIWGERNIDYIPCLETMGEYESAHTWSNEGLKERKEHPLLPLSMLACPAEGHFAYSPGKAEYIALYIKKALQYGHVDPTKTGWLAERWKKNQPPTCMPAPVAEYKGNPDDAFWFFDKEMVETTQAYQARFRNMKPQLVGVVQEGKPVVQRDSHLQLHPVFLPQGDGVSFHLTPVYLDTVPGDSPRLKNWTDLPVGTRIGHAADNSICFEMITGPAVIHNHTFKVEWNRSISWASSKADIVFAVRHPGDKEYKPIVQQAQITIPVRNIDGAPQKVSFAALADVKRGIKSVTLQASSDSGLPVGFYVESGPARVEGNQLIFTPIPPRAVYPVKVTVVAWQYGRSGEPKIQTAEPITQTFYIL